MSKQSELVRDWFDRIAHNYGDRMLDKRPWHAAVFQQRLALALNAANWRGKKLLDIGAGSGALYTAMQLPDGSTNYLACDVSEQMKLHASIPSDLYFVGEAVDIDWPHRFDVVYLLGVTTYLNETGFKQLFSWLQAQGLADKGKVVVSFTHTHSPDVRLRRALRAPARWLGMGTIGQGFDIQTFTPKMVADVLGENWKISEPIWFNLSLTPLQHVFPKYFARLNRKAVSSNWASDFLLVLERR